MAHNHPLLVWDLETSGIYSWLMIERYCALYYGIHATFTTLYNVPQPSTCWTQSHWM